MNVLTPDLAAQAREQLKLSQSKVAKELGINRSYLSQFEGSKRILEDHILDDLHNYFVSMGWEPSIDTSDDAGEELLNSPLHGLNIADGFVICEDAFPHKEQLLGAYYENAVTIETQKTDILRRRPFGRLDEKDAKAQCFELLMLMARQYEIKQILHGQHEQPPKALDTDNLRDLETTGDFVEFLLSKSIPERFLPVD